MQKPSDSGFLWHEVVFRQSGTGPGLCCGASFSVLRRPDKSWCGIRGNGPPFPHPKGWRRQVPISFGGMGDSFSRLVFSGQGGSWKIGTLRKFLKMQRQLQDNLQVAFVRYRTLRCGSFLAEREGFEPPVQLPVHRISSAARSTTPASFPCFADERVSAYGLQK